MSMVMLTMRAGADLLRPWRRIEGVLAAPQPQLFAQLLLRSRRQRMIQMCHVKLAYFATHRAS